MGIPQKSTFSERRFWAPGASQIPYRQHLNNGLKNERFFLVFERTFWALCSCLRGSKSAFLRRKKQHAAFFFLASPFSALLCSHSRFGEK